MTTITVHTPVAVARPRGARIAAAWFGRLLAWASRSIESRTERRDFAGRVQEASRVRSYAQSVMQQDPRFAADLFAAADRHERGG
jgi:hypothetical protein